MLESGVLTPPEQGTPQGGVISPLLANIVLHHVLDEWFARDVQPRLKGRAFLIRYADDFLIGVSREDDARRIMEVLPKRMSKYGLEVHPGKTRLVRFLPAAPDEPESEGADPQPPKTFDFLGFTHYWGRSRAGRMGGPAQDGEEPIATHAVGVVGVVPVEPTPADRGSTPQAESETAGPLWLLRDHRQLRQPAPRPARDAANLASLAVATSSRGSTELVGPCPAGESLRTPEGPSGPRFEQPRSENLR